MEQRQLTFDDLKGRKARDRGMESAAEKRRFLLDLARRIAVAFAYNNGEVTADDVQRELIRRGFNPRDIGNAAGSIFKTKEWEFTGRWLESARVSNHARAIRVWRLKNGGEQ